MRVETINAYPHIYCSLTSNICGTSLLKPV
jgi:hypothetical protein